VTSALHPCEGAWADLRALHCRLDEAVAAGERPYAPFE
jgi:hypothetical protein